MDLEKASRAEPLLSSFYSRLLSLSKQHRPFVIFLIFATILLLGRQLPWATRFPSSSIYDPAWNQTMEPGNGTFGYRPDMNSTTAARFAKIAVASGFEDILYEKALETHVQHAMKHGYPLYMGRENAADGMFNKIAFILEVLLNELFKPAEERVEWLFYFDADSIIMNQEIPLEIFEPPSDYGHINWLAGKDFNGLNAGVFILRVNQWSLNLLNRVMTYKHYHPDEEYTFQEQTILARLTENDSEFSGESIYVPKAWINAYFYSLHEAKPGLLLSHFPHPDYKWHIYEWLRVLEADQQGGYAPVYNKPVQQTDYPDEIKRFWNVKRRADKALKGFERNIHRGADPVMFGLQHEETKPLAEDFRGKYEDLKVSARLKADEVDRLEVLIQQAEESNALLIQSLMAYFETHDDPPSVAGF